MDACPWLVTTTWLAVIGWTPMTQRRSPPRPSRPALLHRPAECPPPPTRKALPPRWQMASRRRLRRRALPRPAPPTRPQRAAGRPPTTWSGPAACTRPRRPLIGRWIGADRGGGGPGDVFAVPTAALADRLSAGAVGGTRMLQSAAVSVYRTSAGAGDGTRAPPQTRLLVGDGRVVGGGWLAPTAAAAVAITTDATNTATSAGGTLSGASSATDASA